MLKSDVTAIGRYKIYKSLYQLHSPGKIMKQACYYIDLMLIINENDD